MYFLCNPGTGPLSNASKARAKSNMDAFRQDVASLCPKDSAITVRRRKKYDSEGRYGFRLRCGKRKLAILMPGLPLDEVRIIDDNAQNVLHFPRLYVGGSSFYWHYAKELCAEIFCDGEERAGARATEEDRP